MISALRVHALVRALETWLTSVWLGDTDEFLRLVDCVSAQYVGLLQEYKSCWFVLCWKHWIWNLEKHQCYIHDHLLSVIKRTPNTTMFFTIFADVFPQLFFIYHLLCILPEAQFPLSVNSSYPVMLHACVKITRHVKRFSVPNLHWLHDVPKLSCCDFLWVINTRPSSV